MQPMAPEEPVAWYSKEAEIGATHLHGAIAACACSAAVEEGVVTRVHSAEALLHIHGAAGWAMY